MRRSGYILASGIALLVMGLVIGLGWFCADEEGDVEDAIRRNREAENKRDIRMYQRRQGWLSRFRRAA